MLPTLLLIKVNQYSALIVLVLILVTMMTTLWPIEKKMGTEPVKTALKVLTYS